MSTTNPSAFTEDDYDSNESNAKDDLVTAELPNQNYYNPTTAAAAATFLEETKTTPASAALMENFFTTLEDPFAAEKNSSADATFHKLNELHYQTHPPLSQPYEEITVTDTVDTVTVGTHTSAMTKGGQSPSELFPSPEGDEQSLPVTAVGTGLIDQQLYSTSNGDATASRSASHHTSQQQPVFLNRLQNWRKQAMDVVVNTTSSSAVKTTRSTTVTNNTTTEPVKTTVQNLWERSSTAAMNWNATTSNISSSNTTSGFTSDAGSTVVLQSPLETKVDVESTELHQAVVEESTTTAIPAVSNNCTAAATTVVIEAPTTNAPVATASQTSILALNNNNEEEIARREATFRPGVAPAEDSQQQRASLDAFNDNETCSSDGGDESSYVSSSAYTDESSRHVPAPPPPLRAGVRALALQWAAASVVMDNVVSQTPMFRGRYATATTTATTTPPNKSSPSTTATAMVMPENQATRILKLSATADHFQKLTAHLQPHEYLLLLGRGKLGVNLKQCYCAGAGVYTDYLVPLGSADRSGLVSIGDVIVSVGNVDCGKGTIATVPATIASAHRPVHLVFGTSGAHSSRSNNTSSSTTDNINHVDVAVAILHLCTKPLLYTPTYVEGSAVASASDRVSPKSQGSSDDSMEAETGMSLVQPTSFDDDDDDESTPPCPVPDILTATDTGSKNNNNNSSRSSLDAMVNPAYPAAAIRQAYWQHAAKRNTDPSFTIGFVSAAISTNDNVRAAVRNAFLLCIADGRRLPFLQRYLQKQEEQGHGSNHDKTATASATANYTAMLNMFVEMFHYTDFHGVMPVRRQWETARTIAHKFFLPSVVERNEWVPPKYDFHTIVSDSCLRAMEAVLQQQAQQLQNNKGGMSRMVFIDFQHAALESLTEGPPFLGFLISPDCARMRAYLRNTAPFMNVSLSAIFDSLTSRNHDPVAVIRAKNYFLYSLVYLLCMMDKEDFGENDDLLDMEGASGKGNRIENAASGVCAALFIRCKFLPAMEEARNELSSHKDFACLTSKIVAVYEQLWEVFVAPGVGALDEGCRSTEAVKCLQALRCALEEIRTRAATDDLDSRTTLELLIDTLLAEKADALAGELIFEYALNQHPKFRIHKFHEWLCAEIATVPNNDTTARNQVPALPTGCVKRLLRKVNFPVGVTPHKPSHDQGLAINRQNGRTTDNVTTTNHKLQQCSAECAIVFGTRVGLDLTSQMTSPVTDSSSNSICRYTCQSVALLECDEASLGGRSRLAPDDIPATLESFAVGPLARSQPFQKYARNTTSWQSADGWEVNLVNFMLPPHSDASSENAEDDDSSLYGVSLTFQRRRKAMTSLKRDPIATELCCQGSDLFDQEALVYFEKCKQDEGCCDSMDLKRKVRVSSILPTYSKRLAEPSWSERMEQEDQEDSVSVTATVGVALVSKLNVVLSMRETLSHLVREFSKNPEGVSDKLISCGALVDVLGNFAHHDVESESLKCILEPYLRKCSAPWLERPIGSQKDAFLQLAGQQLIHCLPPIPLALMFVTALLEQKIVLSSTRRSVLMSATLALSALLRPLKWCHLMVARVPASLAGDLLQYPAPFILGLPSEDPGVMDLIRALPEDVTLVDLDVGRVILAPSFAHDSELGRRTFTNVDTARAIRSQVLYLAQSLGVVFGAQLDAQTWSSDNPFTLMTNLLERQQPRSQFSSLRNICQDFIQELLAGTSSCCYWVEEALTEGDTTTAAVSTVLFDEDRFFHIKKSRERNGFAPLFGKRSQTTELALSLLDFDLIIELLLRCQCVNAYIGTRGRDEMAFAS